ncbi:DUF4411 family protein [Fodinibius halophilus]|uniref:DUF4411 family protein n=1 Tax=Fodinibius halophilus TaxID=1736908 RepID=A0A6M1TB45_9BACT|nr:DUF4411 family protein [Fodinibius halophilus]NGP87552.1 DUF4411 family protein [Fodinibius halophilus]
MTYSLDSDVLIQAWRDYPIENFPPVWEKLGELGANNTLGMSELILAELQRGGDELYDWAKTRETDLVIPTSDTINSEVSYLVNTYNNFGIITGKNEADPFVVAVAKAHNCIVVTNERRSGDLNGPKIPDVCLEEEIPWIRFIDIIKRENIVFQ